MEPEITVAEGIVGCVKYMIRWKRIVPDENGQIKVLDFALLVREFYEDTNLGRSPKFDELKIEINKSCKVVDGFVIGWRKTPWSETNNPFV